MAGSEEEKEVDVEMRSSSLLDPETLFLISNQNTGNEWEVFKENVRPLKRGRNVNLLNHSLKSLTDHQIKKSLLHNRRRLIEAIDDYKGDDPLHPWLQCIKWVQESFPSAGDSSGLLLIYEQCVRAFWHSHRYKDDLRYLKVWLQYAENCADAHVIYNFLEANGIGQTHAAFYIAYALHMESKSKLKIANEVFNLGIARKARPIKKLEAVYKSFLSRSINKSGPTIEESMDDHVQVRSFGTVLATGEARRQIGVHSDLPRKKGKQDKTSHAPLSIYKDENLSIPFSHQAESSKPEMMLWNTLGTRAERNKENNAIPSKWTKDKIPQRPVSRSMAAASSVSIEVFVDEEFAESAAVANEGGKSATLQLRKGENKDLKKETELLKENPLRNFPPSSLPR
ncbi:hypothetical protein Scep_000020 [Stephania cephalantha]|uniref:BUB1 N-terminal domain-containing protein n=1 Tax=Stephania cephalantha TaxID=152367 RepID=A0AAP0Q3Q8_9MAGN